ncbi:uncharacterized protein [Mytilus edulis]|uniref:uncharacterized protein n=1 Tax=Mytilus edulis TaxID=6550 RepID=UPI0039EF8EB8
MAFFGAQMNVVCTICEKGNLLKWKCLTCKELLCDDCKVYHEKFRATKNHKVISIKDLNEDKILQAKDQVVTCREHGESCRLFCMDCQFAICTDICIKHHDGHHFEPIKDLRRTIEENTKVLIDEIKDRTKSYSTHRDNEVDERQKLKNELEERKRKLISIIESKYGKLTNELHDFFQNSNKESQTVNDNQSVAALRVKQTALEVVMTTGDVEQLVKRFGELKTEVRDLLQKIPDVNEMSFHAGDMDIEFGSLNIKSTLIRDISSVQKIEIVRKIQTNLRDVDMICPNSNDTTWIGGQNDALVQLIRNSSGRPINKIANNFSNGYVRSDKLYLCSLNEKSISVVSFDGTVSQIKDMQPLYPVCIYVTLTNDIIVGAIGELENYDLNSQNRRVVITMNDKGKVKKELTVDVGGVKLFSKPYRCMVNEQSSDLVVIDKTSAGSAKVVCISPNDDVKFRYGGRAPAELKCKYNPSGVAFTNDYIIVCDYSNKALDFIDWGGQMLKYISVDINDVSSVCFDSFGQLWIGNHDENHAEIFITRLK